MIPHIDVFQDDGFTREEWKMVVETKKILDPKIKVVATCVRVPVFVGHSEAVNIEFENPITADEARELLRNAPGCLVIDKREAGGYATPYEAAGEDATYVSRIREDATVENGLVLWCVSDNLRKGAALNAIQIAECLINRKLIEANARRRSPSPPRAYRHDLFLRGAPAIRPPCRPPARVRRWWSRLSADPPVAAFDLFDRDPRYAAHVLAFDRDHGIGQPVDDLSLLLLVEDVLDDANLDSGICCSSVLFAGPRAG